MTNMHTFARLRRSLALLLGLMLSIGATHAADTVTYYHTDALGTPVMESNAAGVVTYAREHRPYGAQALGAVKSGPGFTGHLSDSDTGLSYMQARYYDPTAGRFLSDDPMSVDFSTGGNYNRYWYANNNPYGFVDRDGRQAKSTGSPNGTNCDTQCQEKQRESESIENSSSEKMIDTLRAIDSGDWSGALQAGLGMVGASWKEAFSSPASGVLTVMSVVPIAGVEASVARSELQVGRIAAKNGTEITGFTRHGVDRAVGAPAIGRAGAKPTAMLDALKNPKKIQVGVDSKGRPFEVFHGENARVVVNPQTGKIVSTNPLSGAGAHK